ncbi:MAG: DUF1566 domain-containing protein [Bacteroidales bacterium]|nr:DUF1566 domain-containing protein [Bacteroidales bacterium]
MRKIIIILFAVLLSSGLYAQAPLNLSYQAVIRDGSGKLLTNHLIGMQISILQGTSTGSLVYIETLTPTTNANGLVTVEIGGGILNLDQIDWVNGPFYLKTETDPTGGSDYSIVGISQLLTVPYALHAKTAEKITETVHSIGESYGGGIVFYVNSTGTHGLIAATQDQSSSSNWYDAQDNCSKPENHTAAGKEYSDWRLPTYSELFLMYYQSDLIGGFTTSEIFYWSSTELGTTHSRGIYIKSYGTPYTSYDKNTLLHVRAVRAF